jgi:hypothetical protein
MLHLSVISVFSPFLKSLPLTVPPNRRAAGFLPRRGGGGEGGGCRIEIELLSLMARCSSAAGEYFWNLFANETIILDYDGEEKNERGE